MDIISFNSGWRVHCRNLLLYEMEWKRLLSDGKCKPNLSKSANKIERTFPTTILKFPGTQFILCSKSTKGQADYSARRDSRHIRLGHAKVPLLPSRQCQNGFLHRWVAHSLFALGGCREAMLYICNKSKTSIVFLPWSLWLTFSSRWRLDGKRLFARSRMVHPVFKVVYLNERYIQITH